MRTFVVGDIHGRYGPLKALLTAAGVLVDGHRVDKDSPFGEFEVISLGDLMNAVLQDVNGDEACLLKAREWFNQLILGNHESGYLFDNMGFSGYYAAPHLRSAYNALYGEGMVVPAVLVGETLVSHAGLHKYFNFETAEEAFDAITDVWHRYPAYRDNYAQMFSFTISGETVKIPKALLLDAVSDKRGGSAPFGGLLWADWDEPKNIRFNQIVGHTPLDYGPVVTEYKGVQTFTANIDCGAKQGMTPWGVWLDDSGAITEYVTALS